MTTEVFQLAIIGSKIPSLTASIALANAKS
jgi:hypothetical protein